MIGLWAWVLCNVHLSQVPSRNQSTCALKLRCYCIKINRPSILYESHYIYVLFIHTIKIYHARDHHPEEHLLWISNCWGIFYSLAINNKFSHTSISKCLWSLVPFFNIDIIIATCEYRSKNYNFYKVSNTWLINCFAKVSTIVDLNLKYKYYYLLSNTIRILRCRNEEGSSGSQELFLYKRDDNKVKWYLISWRR